MRILVFCLFIVLAGCATIDHDSYMNYMDRSYTGDTPSVRIRD